MLELQRSIGNSGVQRLMRSRHQPTYLGPDTVAELVAFWQSKLAALKHSKYSAANKQRRANRYQRYIKKLQTGARPEPHQSQAEVEYLRKSVGGRGETAFKHGRAVPGAPGGRSRPTSGTVRCSARSRTTTWRRRRASRG